MASVAEHSDEHRLPPPQVFVDDISEANDSSHEAAHETDRGRLKRRRMSSHSPPRAPSPSRGHDRASGSRHRHHHREHHRASSSASISPPPRSAKKNRRRSDAEPDHTLRGRARNRSGSRSRSPILEGEEQELEEKRQARKRSAPPSRHRIIDEEEEGEAWDEVEMRRQRSFPNLYRRGGEKGSGEGMESVKMGKNVYQDAKGRLAPAVQEV